MTRPTAPLLLIVLFAMLPACRPHSSHLDPTHAHDDAGGHAAAAERPTISVSRWSERTELFMEYPAFVAGESGRAAIHLTDLRDFAPLRGGEAVVRLRAPSGDVHEFRGGPTRPGIFGADLQVDRPGTYEMTLDVKAPGLQDTHALGPVTVHAAGSALASEEGDAGEAISFLKEQQWTLDFGTTLVTTRRLRTSITVPAVVESRAGRDALLTAPVPGRIDPAWAPPTVGSRVRAGTVLARILPRTDDLSDAAGLRASVVAAEEEHRLAVRERDRVARRVEARALPSRRLDEAHAGLAASEARLEAARARWARYESLSQSGSGAAGSGAFAVRAPFDGVVAEVRFASAVGVEEGQPLVRLVDTDQVEVVGAIPESRAAALWEVTSGELLRDGAPALALGPPLAAANVVDPATRTVSIRFPLENQAARLHVGQRARLRLYSGEQDESLVIPDSAVVNDGGRPVVFVQLDGESFARRPVRLGGSDGGFIQVLEGVQAGERVVHRGAYLVRLAAMSTQIPAHGHVH